MVMRSLIAKIYLWAVGVFVIGGALTVLAAHQLVQVGELDALRRFGVAHATFIAHELERTATAQGPDPARLRELGPPLHAELTFLPWARAHSAPRALWHQKAYFAPGALPGPSWRTYWIRLDRQGKPLGALRVAFLPPIGQRHLPLLMPFAWMGGLALLLVPPLVLWVIRPIRRMVGVAHRLGAGDLDTPVPVTRRDELGELEAAFEGLRERLKDMIAQKEVLLRDVSHELRGPLSRMAIALPLARAGLGDGKESDPAPYLAKLDREVATMDALIGEILELSRARGEGPLRPEPLDLAALASELVAERELTARERGLTLTVDLAQAPTAGEARLVRRAMSNLLDNALKYTQGGGHVRVETARGPSGAIFRVTDDGPGIDPQALSHVFEPFYRPDTSRSRETGGTGLGLAIVKAIAERHGGEATLQPAGERGLAATLRLPAR